MFPVYQTNSKPLVIAHRGGAALWPENTLFALQEAQKLGVDFSEIDVQMTRDGVLVAIHDETIDRTTDKKGLVQELTLAELKSVDAGYQWTNDGGRTFPFRGRGLTIPSLNEIFSAFPHDLISLEIKQNDPPIAAAVGQIIKRYGKTKQVLVSAFTGQTMKIFRRLYPGTIKATTHAEAKLFFGFSLLYLESLCSLAADVVIVPLEKVTARFVEAVHKKNKRVDVYTVNEIDDMNRLLSWAVDGIITDFPDRLLALLASSSYAKSA